MNETAHHKARNLLQVAADQSLSPAERSALDAHLSACAECRAYASQLTRLEGSLRKVLHTKWDAFRPDLNLQTIKHPSPVKLVWNNLFSQTHILGKVTIMASLLLGYVVIVNLVGIRVPITNEETPTVLPTPNGLTSTFATSPTLSATTALSQSPSRICQTTLYIVQKNDTLESIAVHYGITKEAILEYNKDSDSLAANTVFTGMELVIPLCETAPSRTASLPGSMLTITPINGTILPDQPD